MRQTVKTLAQSLLLLALLVLGREVGYADEYIWVGGEKYTVSSTIQELSKRNSYIITRGTMKFAFAEGSKKTIEVFVNNVSFSTSRKTGLSASTNIVIHLESDLTITSLNACGISCRDGDVTLVDDVPERNILVKISGERTTTLTDPVSGIECHSLNILKGKKSKSSWFGVNVNGSDYGVDFFHKGYTLTIDDEVYFYAHGGTQALNTMKKYNSWGYCFSEHGSLGNGGTFTEELKDFNRFYHPNKAYDVPIVGLYGQMKVHWVNKTKNCEGERRIKWDIEKQAYTAVTIDSAYYGDEIEITCKSEGAGSKNVFLTLPLNSFKPKPLYSSGDCVMEYKVDYLCSTIELKNQVWGPTECAEGIRFNDRPVFRMLKRDEEGYVSSDGSYCDADGNIVWDKDRNVQKKGEFTFSGNSQGWHDHGTGSAYVMEDGCTQLVVEVTPEKTRFESSKAAPELRFYPSKFTRPDKLEINVIHCAKPAMLWYNYDYPELNYCRKLDMVVDGDVKILCGSYLQWERNWHFYSLYPTAELIFTDYSKPEDYWLPKPLYGYHERAKLTKEEVADAILGKDRDGGRAMKRVKNEYTIKLPYQGKHVRINKLNYAHQDEKGKWEDEQEYKGDLAMYKVPSRKIEERGTVRYSIQGGIRLSLVEGEYEFAYECTVHTAKGENKQYFFVSDGRTLADISGLGAAGTPDEKEGCVFLGWYLDEGFNERAKFGEKPTEDVELFPRFKPGVKVELFKMGADKPTSTVYVERGVPLDLGYVPPFLPTAPATLFVYWLDRATGKPVDLVHPVTGELQLEAVYAEPVTITLDWQDGSTTPTQPWEVGKGYPIVFPPQRQVSHKALKCWTKDAAGKEAYDLQENVNEPLTLYAQWEKGYDVTLDFGDVEIGGSKKMVVTVPSGGKLDVRLPLVPRKTLRGWYQDAALTQAYDMSKPIEEDLTLYAGWDSQKSWNVAFSPNNGGGGFTMPVFDGEKLICPADPTKTDMHFAGWYYTPGEGMAQQPYDFSRPVRSDLKLEARWSAEEVTYTVKFNTHGGNAVNNMQIKPNGKLPEDLTATYGKHEFGGWYTDATYKTEWNLKSDHVQWPMTLHAKWNDLVMTIFFDSRGGNYVEGYIIARGEQLVPPKTPSKDKEVFDAWYTDKECKQPWFFAMPLPTWGKGNTLTLYAHWLKAGSEVSYPVQFKTGDGSSVPQQMVVRGGQATRPADPELPGSKFLGWYADARGTREFDFGQPILLPTLVFARYEALPETNAVESALLASVRVVWNPFSDMLVLEGMESAERVEVYSVTGALVHAQALRGESRVEMAAQGWSSGVYVVRVVARDGLKTLRVVKE